MSSVGSNQTYFGQQKETIIADSKMLRVLNPDDLDNLILQSRIAEAKCEEVIWREGIDVDFVGAVGLGFVKMAHPAIKGHAYILDIFGPGQVFGLTSVVTGIDCPKSAVALSNVTFVKIPKRLILQLYEASDQLKHQMVLNLTGRMRQGTELLDMLPNGHADQKIAAVLLVLAKNHAVDTSLGRKIEIPLTRRLIATMAGTTVESAIRVLSRWQKKKTVRTDSRHITILDEPALRELLYD